MGDSVIHELESLKVTKILHIEDEGPILMLVRIAFGSGVVIDEAKSIREAVAHIEFVGNNYDAIILDPGLPDFQGLDSIRSIRLSSQSPIVIHTGGDTKDIEALGELIGVYEILHKETVSANGLRRAVEGAMAKHQLRRIEGLLKDMKEEKATFRKRLLQGNENS